MGSYKDERQDSFEDSLRLSALGGDNYSDKLRLYPRCRP
jgi:hypothetical protein